MFPEEPGEQLQLRNYLRVLRRRKLAVVLMTVLLTTAALAFSALQTRVYQSGAEILLQRTSTPDLFDSNGTPLAGNTNELAETEIRILESQSVRDAVTKSFGPAPGISASQIGQTSLVRVVAESTVPARAAAIANAYSKAYIDLRRQQAVDDTLAASTQIQNKVDDLQKQIDDLDNRVTSAAPADQQSVRDLIEPQKDALVQQQALFRQKNDQLQVDSAIQNGPELVTSATASSSPIQPKPLRTAVLAAIVGLLLGVALAFVREHLDDSIKTKSDLEQVSLGMPVLGLIPMISSWKEGGLGKVVSIDEPKSAAAEAYRTLRTALQFLALERAVSTLQITSPGPGEGKTTTIANLAVALAKSGQRVVVVDCDLRRPRLHEFFGLRNDVGFTSVLMGRVAFDEALQTVPDVARLSILASGPLPPNPSEILSLSRTVDVLATSRQAADIVLIDSPPVLPVTDALVVARHVDAVLIVTMTGSTTRGKTARAIELLRQLDAPAKGAVLNGLKAHDSDTDYPDAYYGYNPTNGNGELPKKRRSRAAIS